MLKDYRDSRLENIEPVSTIYFLILLSFVRFAAAPCTTVCIVDGSSATCTWDKLLPSVILNIHTVAFIFINITTVELQKCIIYRIIGARMNVVELFCF